MLFGWFEQPVDVIHCVYSTTLKPLSLKSPYYKKKYNYTKILDNKGIKNKNIMGIYII